MFVYSRDVVLWNVGQGPNLNAKLKKIFFLSRVNYNTKRLLFLFIPSFPFAWPRFLYLCFPSRPIYYTRFTSRWFWVAVARKCRWCLITILQWGLITSRFRFLIINRYFIEKLWNFGHHGIEFCKFNWCFCWTIFKFWWWTYGFILGLKMMDSRVGTWYFRHFGNVLLKTKERKGKKKPKRLIKIAE